MVASRDDEVSPDVEFWSLAESLLNDVNTASVALAVSRVVEPEVQAVVRRLVAVLGRMDADFLEIGDPYFVEALLAGTVGCAGALWVGDAVKQRRELRVPLERTRQALRDLVAERHTAADQPSRAVARWVVTVTGIPQQEIARLLGVAPRTLQRWISDTDVTEPSGDDEMRLRTLAKVIDQLRWSMTPTGVVRWLQRPHPTLNARSPFELLGEPGAYGELAKLAATTRAMVAG